MSNPKWLVVLLLSGIVAAWMIGPWRPAWSQQRRSPIGLPSSELIVVHSVTPAGGQQIVVVDPSARVMGSYAVDAQSGEIALKSVRNFSWDFYLEAFNAAQPAPQDIKALLEKE
jgi:hypothetical protein